MYQNKLQEEFNKSIREFKDFYPTVNSLLRNPFADGKISKADAMGMVETYRLVQKINVLADAYQACFNELPPSYSDEDRTLVSVIQGCMGGLLVDQITSGELDD